MSLDYPPERPSDDRSIMDDYLTRPHLARELGCAVRTIARYDGRREGPPSMMWAGKRLYHREKARRWFESLLIEQAGAD